MFYLILLDCPFLFLGRPDIPSNVSVSCSEPFKARISWIAEFNGGGTQSFLIAFSQTNWNSEEISPVLTSGERGENKFVTISDLQPNIEHKFKVYAKNSYGNVSTKSVYCRIIGKALSHVFHFRFELT